MIVESPGKIKKIRSFLPNDWNIKASIGHVRDLPKKALGIQFKRGKVEMEYVNSADREKAIKELQSAATRADKVYLAMDMDREGEAIAWHVGILLGKPNWPKIKRITFTEITKTAVLYALKNPRRINIDLVNAQQARRALDRLVGFKVSPMLWAVKTAGSSAGRVQSVAVRLVVEREREIRNFRVREYFKIRAETWIVRLPDSDITITSDLVRLDNLEIVGTIDKDDEKKQFIIESETQAVEIIEELKGEKWVVAKQAKKVQKKNPFPPYITSTLQQAASVRLGWNAKHTMKVAQTLYERHGAITYMRTDAPAISNEAQKMARDFITEHFPPEYLPKKAPKYKAKSGSAQEAHECIRPTSVVRTPKTMTDLSADEGKLYNLIWRQFVACQMTPAKFNVATIDIKAGRALFRARGRQIIFDGWTKLTGTASRSTKDKAGGDSDEEDAEVALLPDVEDGDSLTLKEIKPTRHQTKGPSRYTEATLIRALERFGIGRPSTYASIMDNIKRRGYIREDKRKMYAEPVGEAQADFLMGRFGEAWMEYEFTAEMENELDHVAEGKLDWNRLVADFNGELEGRLSGGAHKPQDPENTEGEAKETCEKCGALMVVREGKNGKFLACSDFPNCRNTRPLKKKKEKQAPTKAVDENGKPLMCDKCDKPMVVRHGKKSGPFYGCSGYPECKNIIWIKTEKKCPKCGGKLTKRRLRNPKTGRMKTHRSCEKYPECGYVE